MKRMLFSAALIAAVGFGTVAADSQVADPYANNAAAGTLKFPMTAPAGVDSKAMERSLPGAVNAGRFNDKNWKYGTAFDAPPGAKIWNPVKAKMLKGDKVTGGTFFAGTDPSTYCAFANAGYDFIWVEHQHTARDWANTARLWAGCPHAKAVPGVRVSYADEREIQLATDSGALVVVVPTIRNYEEAVRARDWMFFPPLGKRSQGGGQAFGANFWGGVPGGYRQTWNDNAVLVLMIETLDGLKDADRIAKIQGVTGIFAAAGDLSNHTGYRQGDPDYERNINIVHDAAIKAGIRLCGPLAWRDRPDYTCFQAGSETAAIANGVKADLGPLLNTQGVVEVGPFAAKK